MNYNPLFHHRRSIRLKAYNYSQEGLYFITICTHDKNCLFGNIEKNKMILNNAGNIANDCWVEIPKHFPNVILHEYIIMPNHVHGIIELTGNNENCNDHDFIVGIQNNHHVGIQNFESLQSESQQQPQQNKFQKIIPRSIGSIIRGYKIGVTKWFRNNTDIYTVWQRNYYEHVIRFYDDYERIAKYINNNPANWNTDNLK